MASTRQAEARVADKQAAQDGLHKAESSGPT